MRKGLASLLLLVLLAVWPASTASAGLVQADSPAGLRSAAVTWSKVFLYGSPQQIEAMEGSQCRTGPKYSNGFLGEYLRGMRHELEAYVGRPLRSIKITRIETRRVSASKGDAELHYNLPMSRAGNDNWVTYAFENGGWKVANCHAPIGGESSSASGQIRPEGG